jgi:hypothetical protein
MLGVMGLGEDACTEVFIIATSALARVMGSSAVFIQGFIAVAAPSIATIVVIIILD